MASRVTAWGVAVAVLVALYPAAVILVIAGIGRLRRSVPCPDAGCPTATVVVSARNEMGSLPRCVESLLALDYPADRLDIVLVNDRSTDGTGAWLDALAGREPRVTVLHTEQLPDNGLEAKARGVAHGITRATGQWVLITDADVRVPRTWARHVLGRVAGDATVALAGGVAMVSATHWWGAFERVTWGFLQTINVGFAGWGAPVVSVGPNMGIKRDVYAKAGGLEKARFRIAEDLALFRMVIGEAGGDNRVVQPYGDAESTVMMDEVPTPGHIVSQLRRWVGGALEQGPAYRFGVPLALAWGVLVIGFLVAGWVWWPTGWLVFATSKLASDLLLLRTFATRVGVPEFAGDVWRLWAIQLFAMAVLPISLLFSRRFAWRGAGYAVKY